MSFNSISFSELHLTLVFLFPFLQVRFLLSQERQEISIFPLINCLYYWIRFNLRKVIKL